jgi:hypothetical protein
MRLLLDECLPKQLKHEFVGHIAVRYQQNLTELALGILVLHAVSNDISDLKPLVPAALVALPTVGPGTVVEIGP